MRITPVTSKSNPVFKKLKASRKGDEFVQIEGTKFIKEALESGHDVDTVIVANSRLDDYHQFISQTELKGSKLISMPDRLLQNATDAVTNQGIVALASINFRKLENILLPIQGPLVICDAIQDPGNIGAIVRSAKAFNASAVVLLQGTASPFNAKAIRGSAGTIFSIPLIRCSDNEIIEFCAKAKIPVYALAMQGSSNIADDVLSASCGIIVGNEGTGIRQELLTRATESLQIDMPGKTESLNASIAISIALYELSKRRSNSG